MITKFKYKVSSSHVTNCQVPERERGCDPRGDRADVTGVCRSEAGQAFPTPPMRKGSGIKPVPDARLGHVLAPTRDRELHQSHISGRYYLQKGSYLTDCDEVYKALTIDRAHHGSLVSIGTQGSQSASDLAFCWVCYRQVVGAASVQLS